MQHGEAWLHTTAAVEQGASNDASLSLQRRHRLLPLSSQISHIDKAAMVVITAAAAVAALVALVRQALEVKSGSLFSGISHRLARRHIGPQPLSGFVT